MLQHHWAVKLVGLQQVSTEVNYHILPFRNPNLHLPKYDNSTLPAKGEMRERSERHENTPTLEIIIGGWRWGIWMRFGIGE